MPQFNIRVYGILKDNKNRILVSDELIRGSLFTKFPGGGLEFGEGTRDCLVREFKEETGLTVRVKDHIYTTDFFQISAFNNVDQIISIYYFVEADNLDTLSTTSKIFDFTAEQLSNKTACYESFRFIAFDKLKEDDLSLPIDKIVVELIKQKTIN